MRNKEDEHPPLIRLYNKVSFAGIRTGELSLEQRRELFNRVVKKLELRVGEAVFRCPQDDASLFAVGTTAKDGAFTWDADGQSVLYDCEYRISPDLTSEPLRVEILEEYEAPLQDDLYYIGMVDPTEDFNLVCDFPEDVRLELIRFSMADPKIETPLGEGITQGHGMISIDGWLLPGHGGCVAWYGLAKHQAEPTN